MTTPIALSGLASGLDTEAIIAQLMSVERQPRTRMALQDTREQARQAALRELSAKLGAVRDAAAALKSVATWSPVQQVTSSDGARIAVSAKGAVAPGPRTLEVAGLAVTAQHAFAYTADASPQSLTIGSFTLAVEPGTDAAALAAAINDRGDAPVSAIVAGGRLVLTSRRSGAAGDFSVGATPLLAEDTAFARAGADAAYTIDGVPMTSPSNVVTNAILGAEVTLRATTGGPVTIGVTDPAVDRDAVEAKVGAFVGAYNTAVDWIRGRVAEKPVRDATTTADAVKGLFYGDALLSGALSSLRQQIGDLAAIGVSTGAPSGTATFSADAVAGRLTLDAAKLDAALAGDAGALRASLEGLGDRMATAASSVAGAQVDARLSSVEATRRRLADALAAADVRLASKETRLRAQFSAMESALAASQSAMAQLQSQLGALG